jgi:hypothetical protein
VEEKIANNNDYALQHTLLLKTKSDVTEIVSHPNKKELYRHEKRVVPFGIWMRIAAAVIVLLSGSLFLLQDKSASVGTNPAPSTVKTTTGDFVNKKPSVVVESQKPNSVKQHEFLAKAPRKNQQQTTVRTTRPNRQYNQQRPLVPANENEVVVQERQVIKFDVASFTSEPHIIDAIALNKPITHKSVTSGSAVRTPIDEGDPEETAGSDGDFKQTRKTPAKGFFRKVSRFIERRTGIGTVNDDNELLIGAVALKLK